MSTSDAEPDELSQLLVNLRGGRSQTQAAKETGLSQSKISRAERDRYPLSATEAERYARGLGATDEQRTRLVELADRRVIDRAVGRVALVRVAAAVQERLERLHRAATSLRGWQPVMVPGVLQTDAYTRALLQGDGEGDPGPQWWAARRAMTDLVREPGREWHLIVSEAAMRWVLDSPALMADQVDRILELSELAHVRIGVVDLVTPKPFPAPRAFHLYDTTAVVATDVGTSFLTDPLDVAHFDAQFRRLAGLARYGDDARTLLAAVVRQQRRSPG